MNVPGSQPGEEKKMKTTIKTTAISSETGGRYDLFALNFVAFQGLAYSSQPKNPMGGRTTLRAAIDLAKTSTEMSEVRTAAGDVMWTSYRGITPEGAAQLASEQEERAIPRTTGNRYE